MAQQDLIDASIQYTGAGSGEVVVSNKARIQSNFDELYAAAPQVIAVTVGMSAGATRTTLVPCPLAIQPVAAYFTGGPGHVTGTLTLDITDGVSSLLDAPVSIAAFGQTLGAVVTVPFSEGAAVPAAGGLHIVVASSEGIDTLPEAPTLVIHANVTG